MSGAPKDKLADTQVSVSMLGRFEIRIGGKVVTDSINRSYRIWNLLSYILAHRTRNIPQTELIDAIWPDEENNNPGSTLKTLVYRARGVLAAEFGEDMRLILSQRNSYSWNPEYDCEMDSDEFEAVCLKAREETLPAEERMRLLGRAAELYKGTFLPKLSTQLWVVPRAARYHSMYLDAVNTYAQLLLDAQRYGDVVDVCHKAVQLEPADEQLHTYLILGYLRQGNDSAALSQYEVATDYMYRNLGVQPSEKLRAVYLEIMKDKKSLETDLSVIQEELREAAKDEGAFVCDYGFFREAYRLEARRAARLGSCVHLGLLTVVSNRGRLPTLGVLGKTMEHLLVAINLNLRRGDVVSRYSGAQYVLLLSTANFEDGEMVIQRIISTYHRRHPGGTLKIVHKLQQLEL